MGRRWAQDVSAHIGAPEIGSNQSQRAPGIRDQPKPKRTRTVSEFFAPLIDPRQFVQCVGRERRLVDYYESSGVGLDHYAQVLHDKRIEHGWKYGEHHFPHDITHRELASGKSRLQALAALGIDAVVVPQSNVLDGINVVRRMLGRTWIDPLRCERGLEALRGFRREYDERLRDWKKSPLHSWESHGASALRYFATGFDDTPPVRAPRRHDSEPRRGTGWAL